MGSETESEHSSNPAGAVLPELKELSARAKQGNRNAERQIQKILDRYPQIWQQVGDLAKFAEVALIELASDGDPAYAAMMDRHKEQMKTDLLGETPTPLERMAVQRVVMCWLFVQIADFRCANVIKRGAQHHDLARLQLQAEKRYQHALRSYKLAHEIGFFTSRISARSSAAA